MTTEAKWTFEGTAGKVVVRTWQPEQARFVAVIAHGYGEHGGRYEAVARRLVGDGGAVYAPDHCGHGESDGERALVESVDDLVTDLRKVVEQANIDRPGLPLILIGHSMGGILATLYAQHSPAELAGLVLSGPVIGGNPEIAALLELEPLPEVPIDTQMLSRDPEVGRAYLEDPLVWHGPFKRPTLTSLFGAVDLIARGPRLAVPTLWLHGSEDPLAPLAVTRAALERIRGGEIEEHVYEGARHEVFNETNRAEVLRDLLAFVNRTV